MSAGQQRSNVPGARPQQAPDFCVVVAVEVTQEHGGPGDRLEFGEPGVDRRPLGYLGRQVRSCGSATSSVVDGYRRRDPADAPPPEGVEGLVSHDPVEPGQQGPARIVLGPPLVRSSKGDLGCIERGVTIAQDPEGQSIQFLRMLAIGAIDSGGSVQVIDHT